MSPNESRATNPQGVHLSPSEERALRYNVQGLLTRRAAEDGYLD